MTLDGQQDVAGTRPMKSRYAVEKGRLPRSIRADQTDDLAVVDVKIHMIDRGQAHPSVPLTRRLPVTASAPGPYGLTLIRMTSRRPQMLSFQSCRKRRYS